MARVKSTLPVLVFASQAVLSVAMFIAPSNGLTTVPPTETRRNELATPSTMSLHWSDGTLPQVTCNMSLVPVPLAGATVIAEPKLFVAVEAAPSRRLSGIRCPCTATAVVTWLYRF